MFQSKDFLEQEEKFLNEKSPNNQGTESSSEFHFCSNTLIQKLKMQQRTKSMSSGDSQSEDSEKLSGFLQNLPDKDSKVSPYSLRKDVCYKFVLRNFKNHFRDHFIDSTGFKRGNKNKKDRRKQLKDCILLYCQNQDFCKMSHEFPFYLSTLIFPKDTEQIVTEQKKQASEEEKEAFERILKIIDLFKSLVKNFSELKLKKVCSIPEINTLLRIFLEQVKNGEITIAGLIKNDDDFDQKCIFNVVERFSKLVEKALRRRSN